MDKTVFLRLMKTINYMWWTKWWKHLTFIRNKNHQENKKNMKCRYILIFLMVLFKYKIILSQKGQNISTFHLPFIFLDDFYSFMNVWCFHNFFHHLYFISNLDVIHKVFHFVLVRLLQCDIQWNNDLVLILSKDEVNHQMYLTRWWWRTNDQMSA